MTLIYALLLLVAAACFGFAAFRYSRAERASVLVAIGLLAWVLVPLLQTLQAID